MKSLKNVTGTLIIALVGLFFQISVAAHEPSEHRVGADVLDCSSMDESIDTQTSELVAQAISKQCERVITGNEHHSEMKEASSTEEIHSGNYETSVEQSESR